MRRTINETQIRQIVRQTLNEIINENAEDKLSKLGRYIDNGVNRVSNGIKNIYDKIPSAGDMGEKAGKAAQPLYRSYMDKVNKMANDAVGKKKLNKIKKQINNKKLEESISIAVKKAINNMY